MNGATLFTYFNFKRVRLDCIGQKLTNVRDERIQRKRKNSSDERKNYNNNRIQYRKLTITKSRITLCFKQV